MFPAGVQAVNGGSIISADAPQRLRCCSDDGNEEARQTCTDFPPKKRTNKDPWSKMKTCKSIVNVLRRRHTRVQTPPSFLNSEGE